MAQRPIEDVYEALRFQHKQGNTENVQKLSAFIRENAPRKQKEGARGLAPFANRGLTSMLGAPMDAAKTVVDKITGKDIELPGTTQGIEAGIRGIPQEIGDTLGAPADLLTSGLNLIPGADIKNPVGGSESIRTGKVFGAPVDFLANTLNLIPGVDIKKPFGGSEQIQEELKQLMPVFPEKDAVAETIPEHIGQVVGESAALLVPQAAALRVLSGGKSLISRIATDMFRVLTKQPVTTLGSEATAAVGAGLARGIAEEGEIQNPIAKMGLEMAGGIFGGLAPTVILNSPVVTAIRVGKPILQKLFLPFTKGGKKVRAGLGVKGEISSPAAKVVSEIDTPTITPLPPAIRSGDKRLIAMYKALLSKDPIKETEAIEKLVKNIVDLEGEMRKLGYGSTDIVVDAAKHRIAALETDMDKRIVDALKKAQRRMNKIPKARRQSAEAIIVNDKLRGVKKIANDKVRKIWDDVNPELNIGREKTLAKYEELLGELSTDQKKAIVPSVLKTSDVIHKEGMELTNIREMKGLRSLLLERASIDAPAGRHSRARFARKMAAAILEDMGIVANTANTPDAAKLQAALAATNKFRTKFESGIIGKLLGVEHTGVPAIDPALTLNKSIGREGIAGSVDAKKLITSKEARHAIKKYLGRSYSDFTLNKDTGEFSSLKAKQFVDNNEDVLDLFPDLKTQLSDATSAHDYAKKVKTRMDARKAALRDPKITQAARLLNSSDMQNEVNSVVKAGNPEKEAAELMRKANRAGGNAAEGVRGGFVEWILENSYIGQYNELGEQTLSGSTMLANIRIHEKTLNKVFKPEQIKKMKAIGKELALIEKVGDITALSRKEIIELKDAGTNILRTIFRMVGARIGGRIGEDSAGGSLQLAQISAGNFQKFINWASRHSAEKMVYEAILSDNPELLKTLLRPIKMPKIKGAKPLDLDVITRRMNAWLGSSGKQIMEYIEREKSQEE